MRIIDNREAYYAREKAARFEQPAQSYVQQTLAYFKRVTSGMQFQHKLRVEREVKRRRGLRNED